MLEKTELAVLESLNSFPGLWLKSRGIQTKSS